MDLKLNRTSKKAIYKQIADYIELGISTGMFSPDSMLPSERILAKDLEVNRSTVVAAYEELQSLGIVERKKGSGTWISTDIWGVTHRRIPNWNRYMKDGSLLPNLPFVQQIRSENRKHHIINLSSGELAPSLLPREQFQTIFAENPFMEGLGYDHPKGNASLRGTISQHLKEYRNIHCSSSSILVTSGAQQALHLVVQCLLKPGDAIAIEDPSYFYSLPLFQSAGLKVFYLQVDSQGVDPKDIIKLYKKHRVRMIFLNTAYQNPTGVSLKSDRLKEILEISTEYGIPIVEDDPYSLTSFNGKNSSTLKSLDENGNVLYISSLSKIVASGLRIGWITGPEKVIDRLADAKQQVDFGHSIFPQWVANEFLKSPYFDSHISMLRNELKKRRDEIINYLVEFLNDEIEYIAPEGGIHLWCRLKTKFDEKLLFEEAIKVGVSFVPGSVFGSRTDFVRLTFGSVELNQIREGMARFAEALKASKK
ncbi:PLP-dependent aminotransferase family protein [Psychrobacillus sp.]|uniref:MocR-like pyridoxine biosynthesis transcription factor PdxR n=1 Tax=Psychrobacillus sp. TaxID=1871623 RepID=UPI0028BD973C|nr:PLP-dependent aminotransferase family protein [Psychrobacillus sp.]